MARAEVSHLVQIHKGHKSSLQKIRYKTDCSKADENSKGYSRLLRKFDSRVRR